MLQSMHFVRVAVLQSTRRCLAVLQSTRFFRRCLAELLFVRRLFMEGSLANVDRGNCLVSRGSLQDSMGLGRLLTCWGCHRPSSGSSASGKGSGSQPPNCPSVTPRTYELLEWLHVAECARLHWASLVSRLVKEGARGRMAQNAAQCCAACAMLRSLTSELAAGWCYRAR